METEEIIMKHGLGDKEELELELDPLRADTDSDGLIDGWEIYAHQIGWNGNTLDISIVDPHSLADPQWVNSDLDGDGVNNSLESWFFTNPFSSDSDEDNLSDFNEIFLHFTDPTSPDSDGDNLDDIIELEQSHTHPFDPDTDDDSMPDGWEVAYNLNPFVDDTNLDHDSDSLTNLFEYHLGTSPIDSDTDDDGLKDNFEYNVYGTNALKADTDNDGLNDGLEYAFHSNPFDIDSDNDGLSDGDEVHLYATDPTKVDTDNDQLPDKWEVMYGLNPTDPSDATADFDNDGLTNLDEYNFCTNPNVSDTDGDGWTDYQELYPPFRFTPSDPTDPNSVPNIVGWGFR